MICPDEFIQAQYADRELPEAEAKELAAHLEFCDVCRKQVAALEAENLLLIQSLQSADVGEADLEPAMSSARGTLRVGIWAGVFVGVVVLVRMCLGVILRIQAPAGLDWLYPLSLSGQLNWLANGFFYAIGEGGDMVGSMTNAAGFAVLSFMILGAMLALARRAKGITAMVGLAALMIAFVAPSYAVDIRKLGKGSLSIAPGETIDDTLVVFADRVDIRGTVTGDLIAFARQVNIQGTVMGNLIGFGQGIEITGNVAGDIFGFGQSVRANGPVGQSLWGFGQNVAIGTGGKVERDATLLGANLSTDSDVGRDLIGIGGYMDVGNSVGRDVRFWGRRLSVRAPLRVGHNLYAQVKADGDAQIDPGATIAGKKQVELEKPGTSRYLKLNFYMWQLVRIGAAFIMGLLLFWLFPAIGRVSLSTARSLLTSGGIGFLAAVATPVAAIILAITILGLPIALVIAVLYLLGLYLAKIVVAKALGDAIGGTLPAALGLLAGIVLIIIAINLPYIGGVLNILLILIGLGSLVTTLYQTWKVRRNTAAA